MVRVVLDEAAFGRVVMNGSGVRAALRAEAEKIAGRARGSAPVDSGEYRDSITVESDEWHRGNVQMALERVVTTAPHGLIVEARTGNLKRAIGG